MSANIVPSPRLFNEQQKEAYRQWHAHIKKHRLDPTSGDTLRLFRQASMEAWHGFDDPRWKTMSLLGSGGKELAQLKALSNAAHAWSQPQTRAQANWSKALRNVRRKVLVKEDWNFLINKL